MVRKEKKKSIGQYIIDLTPLLDVIFILLIVVLCYQDNFSSEARAEIAAADEKVADITDEKARTDGENTLLSQQLETYENLNNYVDVITIYSNYQPSNRKYRNVYVQINAGDVWEKELNPSNEKAVWSECKEYIEETLADNDEKPVVLSVKDEKMLYRDEQSIEKLYADLELKNKYVKNDPEEADE